MPDVTALHCREIDRCNQRGGRMLSIVDLLEAGTIDREPAAWALAAIGKGASFMVGALPGGAGKTTVMGALLNFLPADLPLAPADSLETIRRALDDGDTARRCWICHEISPGAYYAYLWGRELRAYFRLAAAGHVMATNLHADTLEEARRQVCTENGVAEEDWRRMNLVLLLRVDRPGPVERRRRIIEAWESDGSGEHVRIWADGSELGPTALVSDTERAEAAAVLDRVVGSGARTIDEVRRAILESRDGATP